MGGRAALIVVIGFGVVLGLLANRLNTIGTTAASNYVTYDSYTTSHDLAQVGTNVGLSKLYQNTGLLGTVSSQSFSSGSFSHGAFVVTVDTPWGGGFMGANRKLQSISTYITSTSPQLTLHDTVVVILKPIIPDSFRILGLMMGFGGVGDDDWDTRDTMVGGMRCNGNIHVIGSPVFMNKVSISKNFKPPPGTSTDSAIFKQGYESGVKPMLLPTVNDTGTVGSHKLFDCADTIFTDPITLQFYGGNAATDMDGYVIIRNGLHAYSAGGIYSSKDTAHTWSKKDSLLTSAVNSLMRGIGSNSTTMYAGTAGVGIYQTTNQGVSWSVASGMQVPSTSILALASDTGNRNNNCLMYAGTKGNGIWQSGNDYASGGATQKLNGLTVQAIALNKRMDTILAGTSTKGIVRFWGSNMGNADTVLNTKNITALVTNNSGAIIAGSSDSLYYSTNSGTTWLRTTNWDTTYKYYITSLAFNKSTNVLYLGTLANGVWRDTTGTGLLWVQTDTLIHSDTLQHITGNNPRITSLWAKTINSVNYIYAGTVSSGVFTSTDKGRTWSQRDTTLTHVGIASFADFASSTAETLFTATSQGDTLKINSLTAFPHGVIKSYADISVFGKVDTRKRLLFGLPDSSVGMTIGTTGAIYIEDDITLENPPVDSIWRVDSTSKSNDMLALVAFNGIIINNGFTNAPKDTTKKMWRVEAIVCNLQSGPNQTFLSVIGPNGNDPTYVGYVRSFGGVIVERPIQLAQTSNNKFNGLHRYFQQDPRLKLKKNPPCFPTPKDTSTTPQLKVYNWWENVRVPKY